MVQVVRNSGFHIGLVCPGGPITQELADEVSGIAKKRFGGDVSLDFHDQCFKTAGHFAGTDAERSAVFLDVANDAACDAVWFARGGYGACRLDPALWRSLNDNARKKTYLGYSDAGMLLARLYKEKIGRPAHGPMPTDFSRDSGEEAIARALDYLADGRADTLEPTAKSGAPCAAFNITVLAHLVGTEHMPDLSGHIIMLEDVAEYLYATDRAMFTITSDRSVRASAGVMLGRLSDIPENDRPFGQTEEEVAEFWCKRTGIDYLGRADIGHDAANKIVPFGSVTLA